MQLPCRARASCALHTSFGAACSCSSFSFAHRAKPETNQKYTPAGTSPNSFEKHESQTCRVHFGNRLTTDGPFYREVGQTKSTRRPCRRIASKLSALTLSRSGDNLARLPPGVRREIPETMIRAQRTRKVRGELWLRHEGTPAGTIRFHDRRPAGDRMGAFSFRSHDTPRIHATPFLFSNAASAPPPVLFPPQ